MLYYLKKEIGHDRRKDKSTNKKLRDNTHPLPPRRHPDMNQPPPTYPIPPSFVITIQWTQNSWYK